MKAAARMALETLFFIYVSPWNPGDVSLPDGE
jgi:hypothetical protein